MDVNRIEDIEKAFVERRDWPRAAIGELIDDVVLILPAEAGHAPSVELINLSEAGAGILLPMPVERGARVTLGLAGAQISSLNVPAEVRWIGNAPLSTGKYAAGLKFMYSDAQKQSQLRELMHTLRLHRKS